MADYNDSSITQLIGKDRIRLRPSATLGSDGLDGARHGFIEVTGNSLDEKSAGFGNRLDVVYYKDGSISVRDYGRGVPLGWNEGVQNWNWHVIYNDLYGGGKYETYQAELEKLTPQEWANFDFRRFNYIFSVGLNGLGGVATQYTSEFFEVKSYSKGYCTSRSFIAGEPIVDGKALTFQEMTQSSVEFLKSLPEEKCETDEPDGTFIHWKPDIDVFSDVNVGSDWLRNYCKDTASVANIEIHYTDEAIGKEEVYAASTLLDLAQDKAGVQIMMSDDGEPLCYSANRFDHGTLIKPNGKNEIWLCQCDLVVSFTKSHVDTEGYHNLVRMKTGTQYTGARMAFKNFIEGKAKQRGVKIQDRDWDGSFSAVISTKSNTASLRGQTKDGVDDGFIYDIVYKTITGILTLEEAKGNRYLSSIVESVVEAATERQLAKEHAELARKAETSKREKAPDKFVSCDYYEAKKYDKVELWITEGDSAAGAVKNARSSLYQCILPIRGKGLNVAKSGRIAALENKEIREIFSILGTGFDLDIRGRNTFDISKLKVGKVIFATDADEDGYQIRVLLFLMFYMLAPQLIEDNRVFIAETPRYHLEMRDGSSLFARNDEERDQLRKIHGSSILKEHRFKGLGAVNRDILRETTVHPDTRNLIPITCDRNSKTEIALIEALFGKDTNKQRKELITKYLGANVGDMLTDMALRIGEIDEMDIEDEVDYSEVTI